MFHGLNVMMISSIPSYVYTLQFQGNSADFGAAVFVGVGSILDLMYGCDVLNNTCWRLVRRRLLGVTFIIAFPS